MKRIYHYFAFCWFYQFEVTWDAARHHEAKYLKLKRNTQEEGRG